MHALTAFAGSCLVTALSILIGYRHLHQFLDSQTIGPQKFHAGVVPRVGGIGIVVGVLIGVVVAGSWQPEAARIGLLLLVCGSASFLIGIAEDLTKRVSARRRLVFTCISAALVALALDVMIRRTDLPGVDMLVASWLGALAMTVFVVCGISHAINLIDGFNGLASVCVVIILAALALIAMDVGDQLVATLALVGIGAVLGFCVFNFPSGWIILGDGGAYFLGFYVAELSLLLLARHPEVSPLAPLLLVIYPVFETLFTMWRRVVVQDRAAMSPDGSHLHSLIFRRLLRKQAAGTDPRHHHWRNSLTSIYLWVICLASVVPAVLWWHSPEVLMLAIFAFGLAYWLLYRAIVRFRTPRWMVRR